MKTFARLRDLETRDDRLFRLSVSIVGNMFCGGGGGGERLCVPVSFYFPLLHNLALLALRVHVELRLRLFKKQLILLKEVPRGCVTTNLLPAVVLVHSRRITLLTFHRHKIIGGKILIKNIPWRLTLFSK